jgi:hypothetical protein
LLLLMRMVFIHRWGKEKKGFCSCRTALILQIESCSSSYQRSEGWELSFMYKTSFSSDRFLLSRCNPFCFHYQCTISVS